MSTPSGMITAFGGPLSKVPNDWVPCDGTTYDRTKPTYTALFNAIGDTWGGDGVNLFAVPDLQGQFLRGVSDNSTAGLDPEKDSRTSPRQDLHASGNQGNAVGSIQRCQIQNHNHSIGSPSGIDGPNGAGANFVLEPINRPSATQTNYAGGKETRPVNAYVYFIIKL
jgi:microcystin-dependent protein